MISPCKTTKHSPYGKRMLSRIGWYSVVIVITFLAAIFYFINTYQFAFNHLIQFNENYSIISASAILLGIYTLNSLVKKQISILSIVTLISWMTLLICCKFAQNREYLIVTTFISLLYLVLTQGRRRYSMYLIAVFTIIFSCNSIICIYVKIRSDVLIGIIDNPGILGIYSSISLPLTLYYLVNLNAKMRNQKSYFSCNRLLFSFLACTIILAIILIVKSESRTALVTSLVILSFYLKRHWFNSINKAYKSVLYFIGVFIIFILGVRFFITAAPEKIQSLSGRILMSRIAGLHFFDNFWFGTGIGKFSWFYPQWQADYFKELSAINGHISFNGVGESYVILNEFLQLFLTVGAVGFSMILILIYKLLTAKSSRFSNLFFCLKSVIIGILVACFSSYPLHSNIVLLYLVTCSSVLLSLNENNYRFLFWKNFANKIFPRSVCLISLGLCLIISLDAWTKKQAVAKWQELKYEYSSFEKAKHKYNQLYPLLRHDAKFLIDYGRFILENDPSATPAKLVEAIGMLESAKQTLICKEGMEILAYGYWLNKNYNKAIEHFEWVSNFVPYLFSPKLALMKINLKLKNYKKAKDLGVWILTSPPKIPSKEVELIKIEAQSLVEQFNLM